MSVVDFTYYTTVYLGTEADATSFPTLNAHAERVVNSMTRWQVNDENFGDFPSLVQTLYKLAVCSQIDFLAINGVDSMAGGEDAVGFSVGKVRVDGKSKTSQSGAMSSSVSPATISYLEQSGLMYPGVPVVGGCVC